MLPVFSHLSPLNPGGQRHVHGTELTEPPFSHVIEQAAIKITLVQTSNKQTSYLNVMYLLHTYRWTNIFVRYDLGLPNPNITIEFLRAINNLIKNKTNNNNHEF